MKKNVPLYLSSSGKYLARVLIVLVGAASQARAQRATVSLGSGGLAPGGSATVAISLSTSGGVEPAGLQWTMSYPMAITNVSVVAGGSANAAGKTVTCNATSGRTICIVFGLNRLIVSDGVVATATFQINSGTVASVPPVWIAGVVVTDLNGGLIPTAPPSGTASNGPIGRLALNTLTASKTESRTTQVSGVTLANIATGAPGDACSPGGLASILGVSIQGTPQKVNTFPLSTKLAGVQVKVNDIAAPLVFASDSQINFQCPALEVGTPLKLTVEDETGVVGSPIISIMQAATPGLFTMNATNQGVILLGSTNEIAMSATKGIASRPAMPSEPLTIYASGLGEAIDGVAPGQPAPSDRRILLKNKVSVVVGEIEFEPDFAGLAAGTAGLYQVNLRLPADVPRGDSVPVYLKVTSNDGTVMRSNTVNASILVDPSRKKLLVPIELTDTFSSGAE